MDLAGRRAVELVAALRKSGFTPRFADAAFIATTHVIPVVHTASSMPIDVVLAGPGLEQLFLDEVHLEKLGRRQIPFLSIEHLIVTKVLAGRPKDVEDVREFVARATRRRDRCPADRSAAGTDRGGPRSERSARVVRRLRREA